MIAVPLGNRRGLKIWNCIKRKKLRHLAEAFFFRNIDKASRKHYNNFAAVKPAWIEILTIILAQERLWHLAEAFFVAESRKKQLTK
nr:MAG TPA: hypothetical protein [Caudoviricetes sp.]